jgi:hypothetical protein
MERLERTGVLTLVTVLSVQIWTGGPLLALWIGSQVQGPGHPQMGPVAVVAISLIAITVVLVLLLGRLDQVYDRMVGTPRARQQLPWMRSMRGERPETEKHPKAVDIIVILSVVAAVIVFEVWFFFFAGSPI